MLSDGIAHCSAFIMKSVIAIHHVAAHRVVANRTVGHLPWVHVGILLKASQHTIPKKNVLAAWDVFSEIFGMPLRVANTGARDLKDIDRIEEMMARMGKACYAVLPNDTTIQFVESTKSDAFNVYDKRVDRANSEISKLIIGQTMTIEDGSSLSQS